MALERQGEYFTSWTHVENGRVMNRRLHRIEIQARDGRMYIVTGKYLPDYLHTGSGHAYKGEHLLQMLLGPEQMQRSSEPAEVRYWPTARDVTHAALGIACFLLLRFLAVVA